jgi:hypothetical protein
LSAARWVRTGGSRACGGRVVRLGRVAQDGHVPRLRVALPGEDQGELLRAPP